MTIPVSVSSVMAFKQIVNVPLGNLATGPRLPKCLLHYPYYSSLGEAHDCGDSRRELQVEWCNDASIRYQAAVHCFVPLSYDRESRW